MRRCNGAGNRGAGPFRNRSDTGMRTIKQKLWKLSAWVLAAGMSSDTGSEEETVGNNPRGEPEPRLMR